MHMLSVLPFRFSMMPRRLSFLRFFFAFFVSLFENLYTLYDL
jgi:hypothetical protein